MIEMSSRRRLRPLPLLTAAVGLTVAVPAAMHLVAVVGVAYGRRGGYDPRLAVLLWVGWTSLVCGLLMVAAARTLVRNPAGDTALKVAGGAAAVFAVATALLTPIDLSFGLGILIYGGYATLASVLLRRHRAQA